MQYKISRFHNHKAAAAVFFFLGGGGGSPRAGATGSGTRSGLMRSSMAIQLGSWVNCAAILGAGIDDCSCAHVGGGGTRG